MTGWNTGRFAWGTAGGAVPQFSVEDKEVLGNVQLSLLEPDDGGATWPSEVWTQQQVVQYLNDRQRRFLSESGITVAIVYTAGQSGQQRFTLPTDCVDVRRVAWANSADPMAYVDLPRTDYWELDHSRLTWPTDESTSPELCLLQQNVSAPNVDTPTQTVDVLPTPTDIGEIELTESTLGAPCDGFGVLLSIPDDFTPYIAWGIRADMLSNEYEGNDPLRAQHCEERFQEGIELARIMVSGGV